MLACILLADWFLYYLVDELGLYLKVRRTGNVRLLRDGPIVLSGLTMVVRLVPVIVIPILKSWGGGLPRPGMVDG